MLLLLLLFLIVIFAIRHKFSPQSVMSDLLTEAEAEQEREEARERAKEVAAAAEGFGREKSKGNNNASKKSLEDRNQASRRLLALGGFLVRGKSIVWTISYCLFPESKEFFCHPSVAELDLSRRRRQQRVRILFECVYV